MHHQCLSFEMLACLTASESLKVPRLGETAEQMRDVQRGAATTWRRDICGRCDLSPEGSEHVGASCIPLDSEAFAKQEATTKGRIARFGSKIEVLDWMPAIQLLQLCKRLKQLTGTF